MHSFALVNLTCKLAGHKRNTRMLAARSSAGPGLLGRFAGGASVPLLDRRVMFFERFNKERGNWRCGRGMRACVARHTPEAPGGEAPKLGAPNAPAPLMAGLDSSQLSAATSSSGAVGVRAGPGGFGRTSCPPTEPMHGPALARRTGAADPQPVRNTSYLVVQSSGHKQALERRNWRLNEWCGLLRGASTCAISWPSPSQSRPLGSSK